MVKALNEHNTLPKLIVMVLDDDITSEIRNDRERYGNIKDITYWLISRTRQAIDTYKDYLPIKSKKSHWPHVLWISLPMHKNFSDDENKKRELFRDCLAREVKFAKGMTNLKMIKVWDFDDENNFIREANRFTSEGLAKYWLSIDSAIRYWCVAIYPKLDPGTAPKLSKKRRIHRQDKYHWSSHETHHF